MFKILQFLQAKGFKANILDRNVLVVGRNSICAVYPEMQEHEVYEYFEMVLQDAFPKSDILLTHKDDAWIQFQVG